jgi:hypothetical protein
VYWEIGNNENQSDKEGTIFITAAKIRDNFFIKIIKIAPLL